MENTNKKGDGYVVFYDIIAVSKNNSIFLSSFNTLQSIQKNYIFTLFTNIQKIFN